MKTIIPICDNCEHRQMSLFKNCTEKNVALLTSNREEREYKKGDILLKEGTTFNGIYCIYSGLVKIVKLNASMKRDFFLWFAKPGEAIGLRGFVHKENHSYTAIAASPCKACFISSKEFENLIVKEPLLSIDIMKSLCKRIHYVEERINDIYLKKTPVRLAELLHTIITEINLNKDMEIKYTVEELSDMIGTTPNYLYKIVANFKSVGILERKNKKIKIHSIDKLMNLLITEND